MSENTMNITSISTELSRPDQNSSISNENDDESEIIQLYEKNGFLTFEGDDGLPTPLNNSCWYRYRHFIQGCAVILFTILAITAGTMIVCLTALKPTNATCILSFERTTQSQIVYDSVPEHVAVGDFNQDNLPDLVVANTGIDNIGVRLATGNGSFADQILYSTGKGSEPCWVAVNDFNNDHLLDIIVANYGTNSIGLFLGNGHGSFRNQMIFSLDASHPVSLAIGDFNNDHQWDIAVVNNGTFNLTILFGFGDGSFQIGALYNMGYDSMPCSVAVADLNNDNRSDIAVVNCVTSELVVFLTTGNGSGLFSIGRYSTGINSYPSSVTLNYFNDDNYMDIAIVNSATQNVGVFLGSSNGTFTSMRTYSTGPNSYPQFIASGLFNNGTKYDLIVADSGQGNIIVFEGDGNGSFSLTTIQPTGYNSNPSAIAVADFNNNNQSDAVIVNNGINTILVFTTFIFYTTANQTPYDTGTGSLQNFVTVGYFNNDTYLDIVVTNTYNSNIGVFLGFGNGDFGSQQITSIESGYDNPYPIGVGDFNKDKKLDIAIVMTLFDEIDLYFGQGNGSFEYGDPYTLDSDSYPTSIAIADFNNDKNPDIATANYDNDNIAVLLGSDNGTFSEAAYYSLSDDDTSPIFVDVGDFNNDGFIDIASANDGSATISVLLGNGDGTFRNAISININNNYPAWLAIGDLHNDNKQDIVFTSPDSSVIGIIPGNGDGTFSAVQIYATDDYVSPQSVVLGDFNKDQIPDIAVGNAADSSITMFFGTKNESFIKQNSISLDDGGSPYCMATGDFNNDSQVDIVAANVDDSDVTVFLLKYQAAFAYQQSYHQGSAQHPYSITAGGFNNANQLDIVVANSGTDNVQILANYYNGSFMETIPYSTGDDSFPLYVVTGDFNQDNQLDIAVANYRNNTFMIILSPTNETINTSILYSTGSVSYPNSIATGDFNKDGWTDIVVTNSNANNVGVFLGFGYPTFTTNHSFQCERASFPTYLVVGDFNRDSLWDLVVVYEKMGSIALLLGNGDGTFVNEFSDQIGEASNTISLTIGDFNNDTLLDIAVADFKLNTLTIFLGNGNGTFAGNISQSTGDSKPAFIAAGYFNYDHIQDLVVANVGNNTVGVFLGYGNGSFTDEILYSLPRGSSPGWIVANDLNNDTISDLVVANRGANNIAILLGTGNGSFKILTTYSTGKRSSPSSIAVADLDNDNYVDIVVTNAGTKNIAIFFGYGNGTFTSPIMYAARPDSTLTSIVVDDINNDTILDIAVADFGYGNGNIGIFYGLGNRTFLVAKMYFTGVKTQIWSIAIKDFNNDGRPDVAGSLSRRDKIDVMLRDKFEPFGQYATFSTGTGSNPSAVAVQDLNKDGQSDIAVANYKGNNICILLGYGNGSFMNCKTYSTGPYSVPNSIVIGDIDGDTNYDIVVTNSNTSVIGIFFGYTNGTFAIIKTYSTGYGSEPSFASIADLNRDNLTDIVIANTGTNTVVIFYGTGNRTFMRSESHGFPYGYHPTSVVIADLNNDHWSDISVASYGSSNVDVLLHIC